MTSQLLAISAWAFGGIRGCPLDTIAVRVTGRRSSSKSPPTSDDSARAAAKDVPEAAPRPWFRVKTAITMRILLYLDAEPENGPIM
jgi:hypothetical protein